jgi:ankyrin repeat protein
MLERVRVKTLAALLAVFIAAVGEAANGSEIADAVKSGESRLVRALVAKGTDVNAPEADGTTAMHWAVRADDASMVEVLLRAGAHPARANRYGVTPLSLAAVNGNAAIVRMLLDAGATVNGARTEGETVLMLAARTGRLEPVRLLLERGAEVNATDGWLGQTALMTAAAENHGDAVRMLIERGADVNARSKVLPAEPQRDRIAGLALQPLNTTFPRGGFTALMFAARQGALESARVLLAAGADTNVPDPDGLGALAIAIVNGHYDLAALLIEHGADVNAVEPGGRTPLWAAVDMHTLEYTLNRPPPAWNDTLDGLEIVRRLLDRGANPNVRLIRPVRPRKVNSTNNRLLGVGATPLHRAASHADVKALRLLLDAGADSNVTTQIGTTALMLAAGLGWRELYSGGTETDAIEFMKVCLERGADINAANGEGNTPLHGAAQRGSEALIRFLVAAGARLDAKNKQGLTPLDEALGFAPVRVGAAALLRDLMVAKGMTVTITQKAASDPD